MILFSVDPSKDSVFDRLSIYNLTLYDHYRIKYQQIGAIQLKMPAYLYLSLLQSYLLNVNSREYHCYGDSIYHTEYPTLKCHKDSFMWEHNWMLRLLIHKAYKKKKQYI